MADAASLLSIQSYEMGMRQLWHRVPSDDIEYTTVRKLARLAGEILEKLNDLTAPLTEKTSAPNNEKP